MFVCDSVFFLCVLVHCVWAAGGLSRRRLHRLSAGSAAGKGPQLVPGLLHAPPAALHPCSCVSSHITRPCPLARSYRAPGEDASHGPTEPGILALLGDK